MSNKLISDLASKLNGERKEPFGKIKKLNILVKLSKTIEVIAMLSSLMFLGYMCYFLWFKQSFHNVFSSILASIACYFFSMGVRFYEKWTKSVGVGRSD